MPLYANVGPMMAGKTTQILAQLERAKIQGLESIVFKHARDTRYGDPSIIRSQSPLASLFDEYRATIVSCADEMWERSRDKRVVILEEGHMCPPSWGLMLFRISHARNAKGIYSGLETTWRGQLWATTATVLTLPVTHVIRHSAVCANCGEDAEWSQKLRDGQPLCILDAEEPTFQVGSVETYRPLCTRCWFSTTPGANEDLIQRRLIGTIDPATRWGE